MHAQKDFIQHITLLLEQVYVIEYFNRGHFRYDVYIKLKLTSRLNIAIILHRE